MVRTAIVCHLSDVLTIRALQEADLDEADRVMRLAFGTFLGLPDPARFMGDGAYVRSRWRTDPSAAFAAEIDRTVIGSNFATNWGSVGFFGPLSVRPDFWDRGIASRLMAPVLERFEVWGTRHAGLFTFAHSPRHIGLYQKFGFWPRFLTAIMSKAVVRPDHVPRWSRYSAVPHAERAGILAQCRVLTAAVYDGLDLQREVEAVDAQHLGETILVWDEGTLAGLAVCHHGAGTEGGSGSCYVKFAAARPGPRASEHFCWLLKVCDAHAAAHGLSRLSAGVNLSRHAGYRMMLGHGFLTDRQGVAMHRGNDAGYNRSDVFVIDDWR
jgi:GNAT superfamily N-acetyltransferase